MKQQERTHMITINIINETTSNVIYDPNMDLINQLSKLVDKVKDNQGSIKSKVVKKVEAKRINMVQNMVEKGKNTL